MRPLILTFVAISISLSAPADQSPQSPQTTITLNPDNVGLDRPTVEKEFATAVGHFRTDFNEVRSTPGGAVSKELFYSEISRPYIKFANRMGELQLYGMAKFVNGALGTFALGVRSTKTTGFQYLRSCVARTEGVLKLLEDDESSLFITPTAESQPDNAILAIYQADHPPSVLLNPLVSKVPFPPTTLIVQTPSRFTPFSRGIYTFLVAMPDGGFSENIIDLVNGHATAINCKEVSLTQVLCKPD